MKPPTRNFRIRVLLPCVESALRRQVQCISNTLELLAGDMLDAGVRARIADRRKYDNVSVVVEIVMPPK